WGAMIPLAQKERAHTLFDTEFDQLLEALIARRMPRLGTTGTPMEQAGVFEFPLNFSAARQKFGVFVTALFSPHPFSELPLLRGIYFASSVAKAGAGAGASAAGRQRRTIEVSAAETRIRSTGFFTEGFFNQVLRRDGHVAAALQTIEWRPS